MTFKQVLNAAQNAFKKLHKKGKYTPKDLPEYIDLIEATHKVLSSPIIELSISEKLAKLLDENVFLFSAYKTHAQLYEANQKLRDDNGSILPFEQFSKNIESQSNAYNERYLESEYNFAVQSAISAEQWDNYSNDTDNYMLQYRTTGDDKVREEHAALDGITLPKNDPFWAEYNPPNDWGCRCRSIEVLAEKYPSSKSNIARQLASNATPTTFRFNPGALGNIFPPNHPYTKVNGAKEAINALDINDTKTNIQARTIKTYNNGGSLQEHHLLQQKKYKDSDYKSVNSVADTFAQHGHQATIMPTIHINDQKYKEVYHQLIGTKYEGKSPDFHINGNFYEYKSVKSFTANKLTDILRKAEKQSSHIIIDKIPVRDSEIIKSVKYLNQQGKDIQEVWMYDKENKTITQVFKKQKH